MKPHFHCRKGVWWVYKSRSVYQVGGGAQVASGSIRDAWRYFQRNCRECHVCELTYRKALLGWVRVDTATCEHMQAKNPKWKLRLRCD